ncbi:MAG: DUF2834 domain-containing protein [Bacteriovoracia bacterium]
MRWLCIVLLATHTAVSLWAAQHHSFLDFFPPFNNRLTTQIFSDLSMSIIMVLAFIYQDRKRANKSMGPWWLCAFGTILLGSFAPLIYLLTQTFQCDQK